MRICPKCKTPYPDTIQVCARDGANLTTLIEMIEEQEPVRLSRELHGYVVGNYRIEKRLGAGGMGAVYQATHLSIGKDVAIKILREDNAQNPQYLERFFQEARAIAKIGHENIIQILDFGCTPEGIVYLVMEMLVGRSLEELLSSPPSLAQTIHICAQICDALEVAHQQQIIHRDLKPENIFLISSRGDPDFVKVLDFGIAKQLAAEASKGLTVARQLVGTPLYMSPEQSTAVDARSDIYSLGIILYRMLTGELPFDGESVIDILYKHLAQPPRPPTELNPRVPKVLEEITLRALAKNKEERFASMAEFARALRGAVAQLTPEQSTPYAAPKPSRPLSDQTIISVLDQEPPSAPNRTTLSGTVGEMKPAAPKGSRGVIVGAFASVVLGVGGALVLFPANTTPTPQAKPALQSAAQPTAQPAPPSLPAAPATAEAPKEANPIETPEDPTPTEATKPEEKPKETPKTAEPSNEPEDKSVAKPKETKTTKPKEKKGPVLIPGSTEL